MHLTTAAIETYLLKGAQAAGDLALSISPSGADDALCHVADEDNKSTAVMMRMKRAAMLEQILDTRRSTTIYADALWNHVTLDADELAFKVGDVVEVLHRLDKDWWYGRIADRKGWFPASFVIIQETPPIDIRNDSTLMRKHKHSKQHQRTSNNNNDKVSSSNFTHNNKNNGTDTTTNNNIANDEDDDEDDDEISKMEVLRNHKINEFVSLERQYVKRLKDVVEGYVDKARKRTDMFTSELVSKIFSNLDQIYVFAHNFLSVLEANVVKDAVYKSCIGECFLERQCDFEVYSEYCNNHPRACDELNSVKNDLKYQLFFEACRLIQQMIEIPLEGFLLSPVQKICQYPLQLKELIKYTPRSHPDYEPLVGAMEAMKSTAMLINERKRKVESLEKLAVWQLNVDGWQGPAIYETSSELVYSGEVGKKSSNGSILCRVLYIFDNLLVVFKKDILWRDGLIYKSRLNLRRCQIKTITEPNKDNVRHCFQLVEEEQTPRSRHHQHHYQSCNNINNKNNNNINNNNNTNNVNSTAPAKVYTFVCKSADEVSSWLKAFDDERKLFLNDLDNGFELSKVRKTIKLPDTTKQKDKAFRKKSLVAYHSLTDGVRDLIAASNNNNNNHNNFGSIFNSVNYNSLRKQSASSLINFVQKNFKR
ncbi:hypothetical protein HELRODRAFT_174892 [Helobdella robusta]|uniref:Uncharacterized protein n=1 Tax=Helobdella robusta TaxID=6412 RepID=T1F8L0_HELRO|nr:hypothetical protein HELRODRAFT_174892 [Helobdella robusta]ESO01337.1 hypothetical protein HELRODRAFT_174892 [Helobdella robusta]